MEQTFWSNLSGIGISMDDFRLSVKSFVLDKEDNLLLIKRSTQDPHKPGAWEIPGGRLELGEDPFQGLKRETREEIGLEIEIIHPLRVHHFTRDDGQKITMITFFCRFNKGNIELSGEHEYYNWMNLEQAYAKIHQAYQKDLKSLQKYFLRSASSE